ncbi:hypothetical protein [uncultured Legionella sp.]|uniref:hypothetical protein n=1 Tax=uncultured Legionella sp. TaxID=210934 RepID=UPI002636652B|nr:hypothetical protein [uncultured Legionella sp.]
MCPYPKTPDETIAAAVVSSMINEDVLSSTRMTTGDQYFVFDIKTARSEYVIRMTDKERLNNFQAGIYWQEKLIPLGIPLAEFINSDLNGEHSAFPSLLMNRLPGSDICNVYSSLSDADKKNLAQEIIKIQALTNSLPNGNGYGITPSYEQVPADKSWYEFLLNRLYWFKDIIRENTVYNEKMQLKSSNWQKKWKKNYERFLLAFFVGCQ